MDNDGAINGIASILLPWTCEVVFSGLFLKAHASALFEAIARKQVQALPYAVREPKILTRVMHPDPRDETGVFKKPKAGSSVSK